MPDTVASLPTVELQQRDRDFLSTLYVFDGVLAARHVRDHFYSEIADKTFDRRARKLRDAGYINYPTRQQKQQHPIPEKVFWLGPIGIETIATDQGVAGGLPEKLSNDGLTKYRRRLKRAGIHWVREPHWRFLAHHIAICDVRLMVRAAADAAGLIWGEWIPESVFRDDRAKQTITYRVPEVRRGGRIVEVEKTEPVYPDGYFKVSRPASDEPGHVDDFYFLVEVDRGGEPGPRIEEEKIIRGEAYLKSQAYHHRTKAPAVATSNRARGYVGRWLFITTKGPKRVENLKARAEGVNRKPSFFFVTLADLTPTSFFTKPVWYLKGKAEPLPLLPPAA